MTRQGGAAVINIAMTNIRLVNCKFINLFEYMLGKAMLKGNGGRE